MSFFEEHRADASFLAAKSKTFDTADALEFQAQFQLYGYILKNIQLSGYSIKWDSSGRGQIA